MKTLALTLASVFLAHAAIAQTTTVINVYDYGAHGDGTDQTAAINAAIAASNAKLKTFPSSVTGGSQQIGSCPAVYFPAGDYAINTTLLLKNSYQAFEGDHAVLHPLAAFPAGTPAIGYAFPLRNKVSGLILYGFPIGIQWGSGSYDSDQGMNEISDCQFIGLTDTAIQYGNRSSKLKIEKCHFVYCGHVLMDWNCDLLEYRNCWVSQAAYAESKDSAFNVQGGAVVAEDSMFINFGPTAAGVSECAWFTVNPLQSNDHLSLTIQDCRLSKENGGMTLVNWLGQGHTTFPVTPVGLILRGNSCESGQGHAPELECWVRLFACPNFLVIRNNYGLVNACTMQWGAGVTPTVFADTVNSPLTVDVAGNCGGGDSNLGLSENYVLPAFSGKANLR